MRAHRQIRRLRVTVIVLTLWTILVPAAMYYSLPRLAATEEVGMRAGLAFVAWLLGLIAISTGIAVWRRRPRNVQRS